MNEPSTDLGAKPINITEAIQKRQWLRTMKLRVVVTNGCFDLLHVGHLRYLTQARALGDFLWVGLNDDASVQTLKGPTRPINSQNDRAEILCGLRVVNATTLFSGQRATQFLRLVEPDIYVKGGDYTLDTLDPDEKGVLLACHTEIHLLPLVPGKSTTSTIERLSGAFPTPL